MDSGAGPSKQQKSGRKFSSAGQNRHKQHGGKQSDGQAFAADLRKKREARKYIKFLQRENMKNGSSGNGGSGGNKPHLYVHDIISRTQRKPGSGGNMFSGALKIAEKNKRLKEEERQQRLKDREAKDAAIKAYNDKKRDRYKKLCKKTRKGQPIMKYQMEHLLEKVLKSKGMDT